MRVLAVTGILALVAYGCWHDFVMIPRQCKVIWGEDAKWDLHSGCLVRVGDRLVPAQNVRLELSK